MQLSPFTNSLYVDIKEKTRIIGEEGGLARSIKCPLTRDTSGMFIEHLILATNKRIK